MQVTARDPGGMCDRMTGVILKSASKRFLFLQGPHGPFYAGLARALRYAGAEVYRVGFNGGDALFGRREPGFIRYLGAPFEWDSALRDMVETHAITDLVCYGSSRPIHKVARSVAQDLGQTFHVFEEGYLRPYWITYERDGANADSPVTGISLAEMKSVLTSGTTQLHEAPDRWGDMREHMFWGAAYHAALLAGQRRFPAFRPHRTPGPGREFGLHLKQFLSSPGRRILRSLTTRTVRHGGFPYHLVLLQLAHDANFLDHSGFPDQKTFLDVVFRGFSAGAPKHHHLVVKAHPLEDGREPLRPLIRALSVWHGLDGRVHYISGGKIAHLLDTARSAVTVNSTSAEQALWRGLPVKAFGDAVYDRPEFVSDQPIAEFFAQPRLPNIEAYRTYRAFLLATSQIAGGFYSLRGRRKLVRQLPDLMLDPNGPYDVIRPLDATSPQHIRLVT